MFGIGAFEWRVVISAVVALGMAVRGLRKTSLSLDGAVAAYLVGFATLTASWRFGGTLIAFYAASSALTRVGARTKKEQERGHKAGGQRDAWQVLTNSGIAVFLSVAHLLLLGADADSSRGPAVLQNRWAAKMLGGVITPLFPGWPACGASLVQDVLLFAVVGHFACCCGDTWASELGMLAEGQPRLITSCCLRPVPAGTNGGVSVMGTVASGAGGLFVGVVASAIGWLSGGEARWAQLAVLGGACGLLGSAVDSVLGATVQETVLVPPRGGEPGAALVVALDCSGAELHEARADGRTRGAPLLSNNAVNLASIAITTLAAAAAGAALVSCPR